MVGRNDPCPCGSGKKYKKCCFEQDSQSPVNQRGAMSASEMLMQAVGLHQAGHLDGAEEVYRQLLARDAKNSDALHYLGLIAFQRGRNADAVELIEQAIRFNGMVPGFHCNLGNAYKRLNQFELAIAAYRRALALDPNFAVAHYNLGTAYQAAGQSGPAVTSLRRALELNPNFAEAWMNLGNAYLDLEGIDEAETCYSKAIACRSNYADAHVKLGNLLMRFGHTEKALANFERAIQINPGDPVAHASRLLALNYASTDPRQIAEAHFNWGKQFEAAAGAKASRRDPNSRIRVGYVSGDLRQHALRFFMDPVLRLHDREQFHIHCYYTHGSSDAHTQRFRSYAESWLDCHPLSDDELAEQIRKDGIDILVDLSGHTTGGRLATFARKPAPVQASMLGYLNTTGLQAMDYRITDGIVCPPGLFDSLHTEALARLPGCQWCYRPDEGAPEVGPLPAATNGYVTFGVFHNLAKITPEVFDLWARLLQRLPDARLRMVIWGQGPTRRVQEFFVRHGVGARVTVLEPLPHGDYLKLYQDVDIVLDTHPYSGGTTSFESLWMGVPYVTQTGNTVTSRGGASILHHLGLPDLIAADPDDYLERVAVLAADRGRLQELRGSLRQRLQQSPLMAEADYVRSLEALYRQFLEKAA